jgi:RNA polymerase sigma factor (sigma-70 family)
VRPRPCPGASSAGSESARVTTPADCVALVRAAARGDQRAWETLVARFDPLIRSVARRHRLAPADVDDVAQRTWLALVRHIGRLHDPAALGGWLATTARHEALRTLDHARRELPAEDACAPAATEEACETRRLEALEERAALVGALERIRPLQRTLLWLLMAEPSLSYEQISAALGIPIGSIGPWRARALERLRGDEELLGALGGSVRHQSGSRGTVSPGSRPRRTARVMAPLP